jgi:predicted CXXCH cytochrome family protein
MSKNTYYSYIVLILCAILVSSCSTKSSYGIKKIFFDGVPDPFKDNEIVYGISSVDSTSRKMRDSILAKAKSKEILHQPFQEQKCKTCHQKYRKSQSRTTSKDLCYTCHDNLETAYQNLHAPVVAGYCTQCHNPHKSKNKKLLISGDNTLCYNCHDEEYVSSTTLHKTMGEKNCTTCHNAHGGDTNFYLNKNTCFECHDNYNNTYANVHGPVASGLCFSCHENHTSKKQYLLKIANNELCFNCHLQEDIYLNKAHITADKQRCTTCHNPHGAQGTFLLTKNSAQ